MKKQTLVIVLGNTLLMDGVETSLRHRQGLRVIHMDITATEIVAQVKSWNPDVVIFELCILPPSILVSMFKEQAASTYIGLDIDTCRVSIISCSNHFVGDMDELTLLTQTELNHEAHKWKGGKDIEKLEVRNFSKNN